MRAYNLAAGQAVYPGADVIIRIRYRPGITSRMRIVDETGVIYSIIGQPNDVDRRHRIIEMHCQSGVKAS